MWRYIHTDEMYHSAVKNHDKNVLYHSDVYLGSTFNDGIYHWKYVKREKRNGKWVYYYSDPTYDKAKNNYNAADKRLKSAESKMFSVNTKNQKIYNNPNSTVEDKDRADIELQKAYKEYEAVSKNHAIAKKNWEKEQTKKTRGKAIADRVIKIANKASDAHYKAKKKVDEIINKAKKKKKK